MQHNLEAPITCQEQHNPQQRVSEQNLDLKSGINEVHISSATNICISSLLTYTYIYIQNLVREENLRSLHNIDPS